MNDRHAHHDASLEGRLGELADDFARRLELGEAPNIEEYAREHPELAAVIGEVFPALEVLHAQSIERELRWEDADEAGGQEQEPLGDYRIVREIGRGGMGVVYEARELSLNRRVALKVLPFAAVLDARQLQRFKNEAQAAANLHHANIVPVFSLGCARGVYYYAMQYIDGLSLSDIIQRLRQLSGMPGTKRPDEDRGVGGIGSNPEASSEKCRLEDPSHPDFDCSSYLAGSLVAENISSKSVLPSVRREHFRAVVSLAIQAAEGLRYAHEHGVIHRDVKPSNLLVTAGGHLWIADFGLAMMQSHPDLTMPGDLLGTLRYMSPEQALANRVPVDHRTDIYSLGVTIYELLALQPAFAGNDREDLLRRIASEEPPLLRKVDPSVPRELETIVVKAMAKQADERYATVQELADDLRRFLDDKPILAQPPTLGDRVFKWSRRHRGMVITTMLSLITAVVVLSVSTALVAHQRNLVRSQYQQAETHLQIARGNVDRMLRWMEMQEFAELPHLMGNLRTEALEQALSFHQSLLPEKLHSPQNRLEAGQVHLQVGRIRALLGEHEQARIAYGEGIRILGELAADFPKEAEYTEKLARGCFDMSFALWESGQFEAAAEPSARSTELYSALADGYPQVPHYRHEVYRSLALCGLVARERRQLPQARAFLEQAIRLQEELARSQPGEVQHRIELARTWRNLADVQLKLSLVDAAARSIERALSMQRELVEAYPQDPAYAHELSRTSRWWGEVLGLDGYAASIEPAVPAAETEAGYRVLPTSSAALADAWGSLTDALRQNRAGEAGTKAYRESVAAHEKLVDEYPDTAEYRIRLYNVHARQGNNMFLAWRMDEAQEAHNKALEVAAGLLVENPGDDDYRKRLRQSLADLESARSRLPVADLVFASRESPEGVALAVEKASGMDSSSVPEQPIGLLIYADYLMLGNHAERAVPIIERAMVAGGSTPCFHKVLGLAHLQCGRHEEAARALEKAIPVEGGPAGQNWCVDAWTAAYFLDRVTGEQFVQRWADRAVCFGQLGPLPWYYIGLRLELENKPLEAREAYGKAVKAGRVSNPHVTANWAAYRLSRLEAESR